MADKANVLVTDDHTLFRKGTMKLLETFPEIGEIREAENGEMALSILAKHPIDLVLLDLEMPVLDGWHTAKRIVKAYPDTSIIMVSMYDNLQIVSDLIEIGVHSYLLKNAEPEEMHRAIVSVLDNQFYYNQLVSKALHTHMKSSNEGQELLRGQMALTAREIEMIKWICQELTMKEIGDKMNVTESTAHTHRKNLMKKIDARNTVSIVKFALEKGIVSF
jgi:two-component system, NarL family, response regulator DegU